MKELINQITFSRRETAFNPYLGRGAPAGAKSYIASLSFEDRSMEVYWTGLEPPTVASIFGGLVQDVRAYIAHGDDPVNHKQTWDHRFDKRALEDRATKFASLIGGDWFGMLIEDSAK